ncbi:cuticle protein 65-like [Schistocerca gregaria]|uniref:cuticle protein 65-like n=1 Tax=Schistocerca gregaria TaxID=7010 RepID=UPI00211F1594|nr:cuticle protein 65-like [Schistocerca gregaria]
MKLLIVLSAVLAAAVAAPKPGYLGAAHGVVAAAPAVLAAPAVIAAHAVHPGYAAYGPAHIAVRSDGYLLDTPDVAANRAAHLTAVAQTQARDAHINGAAAHAVLAAPALLGAHGLAYGHGLSYGHGYHG